MEQPAARILVVEDDDLSLQSIEFSLTEAGYEVVTAASAEIAAKLIPAEEIDLAIIDYKLPGKDGLSLLEEFPDWKHEVKTILITGYAEEEKYIRALKIGVDDFLKKPYHEKELHQSIEKLLHEKRLEEENRLLRERLEKENKKLKQEASAKLNEGTGAVIIGRSPQLKSLLEKVRKVAEHSISILFTGESGTGKELLARYLHSIGPRHDKPFIAVNCAELSPSVFESELFGHRRGAYTGAADSRAGLIEAAEGGALFLDEITEIPLELQAKILRVVENKSVRRIGSNRDMQVDAQVFSTTNRDPAEAIREGKLRNDLYHRIAELEFQLPPLRERKGDLELLTGYFLKLYNQQLFTDALLPAEPVMQRLHEYHWPGNIRQLANFMLKWCLLGDDVTADEALEWLVDGGSAVKTDDALHFEFQIGTMDEIEQAKQWLVRTILKKYDGNKSQTAKHLGLSYPGLNKILKRGEGG